MAEGILGKPGSCLAFTTQDSRDTLNATLYATQQIAPASFPAEAGVKFEVRHGDGCMLFSNESIANPL